MSSFLCRIESVHDDKQKVADALGGLVVSSHQIEHDPIVYNGLGGFLADVKDPDVDVEETIYTATVSHKHGANVFVAGSRSDLIEELAIYVAEWYKNDFRRGPEVRFEIRKALAEERYEDAVQAYFQNHPREYADVNTVGSRSREPLESAQDKSSYREDLVRALAMKREVNPLEAGFTEMSIDQLEEEYESEFSKEISQEA
jgi:hypothetical protein